MSGTPEIRMATLADAKAIKDLLAEFAEKRQMLPRSISNIYGNIRDFQVADLNGRIVGCCALHTCWEGLAELRSIAVLEEYRCHGLGSEFVSRALNEAAVVGASRVFVLTYIPDYFRRRGFVEIEKAELPHKVWRDCVDCLNFTDCQEIPMAVSV